MSLSVMFMKTFISTVVFVIYAKCDFIDPESVTVSIQEGLVRGRSAKTIGGNNTFYAFQGIPYAEPPIGALRFEAPVPKKSWAVPFNATKDGESCIQGTLSVTGSEDCLFINVYVPKVSGNVLLPVLFFVFGGGFRYGNSTYDSYGPDFLLDEEIIVVTLNYRLGVFGFLSTGDSVVPGNNGLKDQLLALKWVNKNIKNFGGDPHKVTICGESAGAASVAYHMHSPQSRGLFNGVIIQSGSSLSPWSRYRSSQTTNYWLGKAYGLNPKNSHAFVDGLKKLNASDLVLKSMRILQYQFAVQEERNGLVFGPVIEPPCKDAFITARSHELLAAGNFSHVPILIGFNSLEALFFHVEDDPLGLRYDANNSLLSQNDLNIDPNEAKSVAKILKNYYFSDQLVGFSGYNLTKFLSDDAYVRPTREYVRLTHNRIPVYFYQFSYEGDLGGVIRRTYPGAAHAEELCYLWNIKYLRLSLRDQVMRKRMVAWWADFTKVGNPTPSTRNNSSNVIWPRSDAQFTYLDINMKSEVKQYPEKTSMELWDSIYKKFGNPPYDTY